MTDWLSAILPSSCPANSGLAVARLASREVIGKGGEAVFEDFPVSFAKLGEFRELIDLGHADCGLHVGHFQVVPDVVVDVLVVVAVG